MNISPQNHYRIGFILIAISAIWWLVIGIAISARPQQASSLVLFGVLTSAIPFGIGIYSLVKSRKSRRMKTETLSNQAAQALREKVCADLARLGMEVRLARRGRAEERTRQGSLGLITVEGEKISLVNVIESARPGGERPYRLEFVVPDANLSAVNPDTVIGARPPWSMPFRGPSAKVVWKGPAGAAEVIRRLNDDMKVAEVVSETGGISLESHGRYRCWTISAVADIPLSVPLLNCYRRIAEHLLAAYD